MFLKFGKHIQSYKYAQHVLTARAITSILSKADNSIGQYNVGMLDMLTTTETEIAKNVSEMVSAHGNFRDAGQECTKSIAKFPDNGMDCATRKKSMHVLC